MNLESDYVDDGFEHYGVMGMKWGVHKAERIVGKVDRRERKAAKFDIKAAKATKRADRRHAKYDVRAGKRATRKATRFETKAAKLARRSLIAEQKDKNYKAAKLSRKSTKYAYKATKKRLKANRILRTEGYGKWSSMAARRSDRMSKKAAKIRFRVEKGNYYIQRQIRRMKKVNPETRAKGKVYIDRMMKLAS